MKKEKSYYYLNREYILYMIRVRGFRVKDFLKEAGWSRQYFYFTLKIKHPKREMLFAKKIAKILRVPESEIWDY